MSNLIFNKACISWHMLFSTRCGRRDEIEPGVLRIKFNEVEGPTMVGSDVKKIFEIISYKRAKKHLPD